MKTHLAKCRGTTGLPLEYVVRPQLKGPFDAPEDGPEDPPPFGDTDSQYVTIDAELIAPAPILRIDLTHGQLARPLDHLWIIHGLLLVFLWLTFGSRLVHVWRTFRSPLVHLCFTSGSPLAN